MQIEAVHLSQKGIYLKENASRFKAEWSQLCLSSHYRKPIAQLCNVSKYCMHIILDRTYFSSKPQDFSFIRISNQTAALWSDKKRWSRTFRQSHKDTKSKQRKKKVEKDIPQV